MAERRDRADRRSEREPFGIPHQDAPVFVISVAAELAGMHPQTLRGYDRIGLVSPGRTVGGGRRYSWHDIEQLREVARLTAQGIGLEGVRRILELHHEVEGLRDRVAYLEAALQMAESRLLDRRLPAVAPPRSGAIVRWRRPTR
jgi:MerR family transcriptional regulator, heat shock protein HspR